jgi:low affinity Fe/Cu permease
MKQKNIMRRYMKELFLSMIAYTIILITSLTVLKNYEFAKFWQIVISLSPAIPVAFVILAVMRLLKDSDEMQQRVQLLATSFSAAVTGLVTFSYGFLENVGFPKFPTFFIFPMLIAIWGISLGYFSRKYQ